jgi:glycosyltransferase involved in cell wall biosynthesis
MAEKRLTVLQVLPALQSGGVERGTLEVGNHLVEHGHRSLVISAGGRMVEQLEREGSEHFTWDIGQKSLWTLRLIPRLRRFLVEHKVNILHARSRMPAWICYLAWKGMPPTTRPRFITTVHGLYSVNAYSAIMSKGERIIAVSETVRDYLLKNYPTITPERVILIFRGVDNASYPFGYQPPESWRHKFESQFPEILGKLVVTLPGRITRLKGHEDFIKIIKYLVSTNLAVHGLIVGGASKSKHRYLKELHDRITHEGLQEHISFTGERNDLKDILSISTLVLSLSKKPESFGRTTLEALRLGIPTAGYDHGGVAEILRLIYPSGLLPKDEIEGANRRIKQLLESPLTVPNKFFFPLSDMLEQTLALYQSLASEGHP